MDNTEPHTPGQITQWAPPHGRAAEYQRIVNLVDQAIDDSLAESTRNTYRSGWAHWVQWCGEWSQPVLPVTAESLAAFLTTKANQTREGQPRWKMSTLDVWVSAIVHTAAREGYDDPSKNPQFIQTRIGLRRQFKNRPRRMRPLTLTTLTDMLDQFDFTTWPAGVAAARDAAILLIGFGGAFRRSELVALNCSDLTAVDDGLHVLLRSSKTDQEGDGQVKFFGRGTNVQTCPVCALHHWLTLVAIADTNAAAATRTTTPAGLVDRARHDTHLANAQVEAMRAVLTTDRSDHVCQTPLPHTAADAPVFRPVSTAGVIVAHNQDPDQEAPAPTTSRRNRPAADRARLSGAGLHQMVRRRLTQAGIDAAAFGSHSMRAGHVTEALRAGATNRAIMRQTGHTSESSIAIYDREHNPGRDNSINVLGL